MESAPADQPAASMQAARATAGESLVETLAAVLVSALAIVMLSTAVATASNLNISARESSAGIREAQKDAVAHEGSPGIATIIIDGVTYEVDTYGDDVTSYDELRRP